MSLSGFKSLGQSGRAQGEKSTSFTNITQSTEESFTVLFCFVLHRLVSAVNKAISDSDVRQVLIESLAFNKANTESKRLFMVIRGQDAPKEE